MTAVRSSLASRVGRTPTPPDQLDRMAAAAWRDHRKVIVSPFDDDLSDLERAWVRSIGDRRFGKGRSA